MTNKILALKYRPQEFKDLIGQEIVADTIINSIKANKVPVIASLGLDENDQTFNIKKRNFYVFFIYLHY